MRRLFKFSFQFSRSSRSDFVWWSLYSLIMSFLDSQCDFVLFLPKRRLGVGSGGEFAADVCCGEVVVVKISRFEHDAIASRVRN